MQASTKKIASAAGLAVVFALAAGGLALAVEQYVHARDDARDMAREGMVACADCAGKRPGEFRWEIAQDAKMAERIDTF
jgi:hypothetical protein